MPHSSPITQAHLDGAVETIRGDIREVIRHFNESQTEQNRRIDERFDAVDGRLNEIADDLAKVKLAVLDYLMTDRALRNLVQELKAHGIALDEKRIFAA